MTLARTLAALLFLSAVNLALMIPGGLVETRSFPGYGVATLGAFNVFLTVLGLGSLVLAYRVFRSQHAGAMPALAGVAYVAVYGLDLARIFPVSAVPMPATLATMEGIGAVLGLATIAAAVRLAFVQRGNVADRSGLPRGLLIAMGVAALAIVIFATLSAM